jgi:hypothetical protein
MSLTILQPEREDSLTKRKRQAMAIAMVVEKANRLERIQHLLESSWE